MGDPQTGNCPILGPAEITLAVICAELPVMPRWATRQLAMVLIRGRDSQPRTSKRGPSAERLFSRAGTMELAVWLKDRVFERRRLILDEMKAQMERPPKYVDREGGYGVLQRAPCVTVALREPYEPGDLVDDPGDADLYAEPRRRACRT